MLPDATRHRLEARLFRIEGQIHDIILKARAPQDCREVLAELAAAEAAISRVGQTIRSLHLEHCVPEGVGQGEAEGQKRLNELVVIFDQFAR